MSSLKPSVAGSPPGQYLAAPTPFPAVLAAALNLCGCLWWHAVPRRLAHGGPLDHGLVPSSRLCGRTLFRTAAFCLTPDGSG